MGTRTRTKPFSGTWAWNLVLNSLLKIKSQVFFFVHLDIKTQLNLWDFGDPTKTQLFSLVTRTWTSNIKSLTPLLSPLNIGHDKQFGFSCFCSAPCQCGNHWSPESNSWHSNCETHCCAHYKHLLFIRISFVITSYFKKYQLQLKRYSLKLCQTESHLGSCFVSVLHYQNRSPHDKAWNWAAVESTTPRLEERGNKKRKTRGTTNVLSSFFFSFSDPQQVAALFLMQPNSPLSLQRHTHTHTNQNKWWGPFFFIMAELPSIFFFFCIAADVIIVVRDPRCSWDGP